MTMHSPDILELHNWPYPQTTTPPPQPAQEQVPPEAKLMDASITDDLQDITDVPADELYSDYDSWVQSALWTKQ